MYNFRVLVLVLACQVRVLGLLVLVLVRKYMYLLPRRTFSAVSDTLGHLYSECLDYWFLCTSFSVWQYLQFISFLTFNVY